MVELQKLERALQDAGAAGVNLDALKTKIQDMRRAAAVTAAGGSFVDNALGDVQKATKDARELEHQLQMLDATTSVKSPSFQRALAERRAEIEFQRKYAGRPGEAPAGEFEDMKRIAGEEAYANAIAAVTQAFRQRTLARQQDQERAQFELTLVGKSVEEQARLRAAFEQKQAVAAEAYNSGVKASQAELDAIDAEAAAVGSLTQQLAVLNAMRDAQFDRATMFLSSVEQQIASTMRGIYGDDWQAHMNDALATQLRLNNALQQTHDLTRDFTGTFVHGLLDGKSALESVA